MLSCETHFLTVTPFKETLLRHYCVAWALLRLSPICVRVRHVLFRNGRGQSLAALGCRPAPGTIVFGGLGIVGVY
jgi:hypothetical protein